MKNFIKWMKGILSAAIGGAANSITLMLIDPLNYNLTNGIEKLSTVAIVGAIVAVAMHLSKSPIWED
jgi:hypothetical protein